MDDRLAFASVATLTELIRRGEISPVELAQFFLQRIDSLDPAINSYIAVTPERAIAAARAAEAELAGGIVRGPLQGVPVAIKDLFDVAGLPTTAGSRLLAGTQATRDAAVVQKLQAAGAGLLGKTHMVEFAFGGVGINHHYGTPWNPWDARVQRIPGGSSSGSAAAVAAGLAPLALGSDTGGSVRIPAAFCGLVGFKPTYGRISRVGVVPLDPNLDTIGPLARTVDDAAMAFEVLAGRDPADRSTWDPPPLPPAGELDEEVTGWRVCFPRELFWSEVDEEVEAAVRASAQVFAALDADVNDISLEVLNRLVQLRAGVNLTAVETYRHFRDYLENHLDEFDPIVFPRMLAGRDVRAVDFLQQQLAYADLRRQTLEALEPVDFLVTPTVPFAAPPVEQADAADVYWQTNALCLRNTSAVNQLGLCAISVPCGYTREGLPIGLQLIGRPFDEWRLLRLARAYEQAAGWQGRHADMSAFT